MVDEIVATITGLAKKHPGKPASLQRIVFSLSNMFIRMMDK